jgi:hypothetical protein
MMLVWKKLLILMSAASGAICVGVMVLWLRSYFVADELMCGHGTPGGLLQLLSANGGLSITTNLTQPTSLLHLTLDGYWGWQRSDAREVEVPGAWIGYSDLFGVWVLALPYWLVAIFFALLPTVQLLLALRHRRDGICRVCGYDLRARPSVVRNAARFHRRRLF